MAEETGILLESGTNELELLEFVVGTQHYGINVAKINELCPYQEPTLRRLVSCYLMSVRRWFPIHMNFWKESFYLVIESLR